MISINFNDKHNSNINQAAIVNDSILAHNMHINATDNTNCNIPWSINAANPKLKFLEWEIRKLPQAEIEILNSILLLDNRFSLIYASQSKLSLMSTYARETVNRKIKLLKNIGLILTKSNGHNKTLWYKVASVFHNPEIRKNLSDILWALKYPCRIFNIALLSSLLCANETQPQQSKVTRSISYKDLYISYYSNTKKTANKERENQRKILKKKGSMFEPASEISQAVMDLGLKLDIEQQRQLSGYSKEQLAAAKAKINKKGGVVRDKVRLLIWLLRNDPDVINAKQANKPVVKKQVAVSKTLINKVEEKKYTATQMATEIHNFSVLPNNAPMIISERVHETIKNRSISSLIWDNIPVLTGESGEELAIALIESWKVKLPLPVQLPVVRKPIMDPTALAQRLKEIILASGSTILRDNAMNDTSIHQEGEVSPKLKIEPIDDPDNQEEIYD